MNIQNRNIHSKNVRAPAAYKLWTPICLILSTVIAAAIFLLAYDAQTRYIKGAGNILLTVAVLLELAVSFVLILTAPKGNVKTSNGTFMRITTLLLHIAVIFCGVMATLRGGEAKYSAGTPVITVLKTLLLLSAAGAFLANASLWHKSNPGSASQQINGYATIFLCISGIAILYFDMSVEMNNPQKLYIQFSLASICLAKLYEMKSYIKETESHVSMLFKTFSIILAPIAAISTLFAFASSGKPLSSFYLYLAIIVFSYAISNTVELILTKNEEKATGDEPSTSKNEEQSTGDEPSTSKNEEKSTGDEPSTSKNEEKSTDSEDFPVEAKDSSDNIES